SIARPLAAVRFHHRTTRQGRGSFVRSLMSEEDSITELFGPVIHSYTRARAIADGVLVDVSEATREAGLTFQIAVTQAFVDEVDRAIRARSGARPIGGGAALGPGVDASLHNSSTGT